MYKLFILQIVEIHINITQTHRSLEIYWVLRVAVELFHMFFILLVHEISQCSVCSYEEERHHGKN